MPHDTQPYRQCSDCYYWVGHGCARKIQAQSGLDSHRACEDFMRASLHYAFFPKM